MQTNQVIFARQSESLLNRSESISVQSFVEKNSEKAFGIVAGLIEKSLQQKAKKLDTGSQIEISLDSLLNDLVINSSGRITRETFLDYFKTRKEEIAALFGLSKGIPADKFANLNTSQLAKLFSLVDSLIERVSISAAGRTLSASASASVQELEFILTLPELPEAFAAKISDSIQAQSLDFI